MLSLLRVPVQSSLPTIETPADLLSFISGLRVFSSAVDKNPRTVHTRSCSFALQSQDPRHLFWTPNRRTGTGRTGSPK